MDLILQSTVLFLVPLIPLVLFLLLVFVAFMWQASAFVWQALVSFR